MILHGRFGHTIAEDQIITWFLVTVTVLKVGISLLVSLLSSPQGSLNTTIMVVAEATLIMMTMFQMKVGFIMLQLKQEM